MVIIEFRANGLIVTKSFSSPLFPTFNPAKLNACNAVCDYIVTNLMTELQHQGNVAMQCDNRSKDDQSKKK
jgi:hypothetical protein